MRLSQLAEPSLTKEQWQARKAVATTIGCSEAGEYALHVGTDI